MWIKIKKDIVLLMLDYLNNVMAVVSYFNC